MLEERDARIAVLEAALEPFAKAYVHCTTPDRVMLRAEPTDNPIFAICTVGDLRRAAAAYPTEGGEAASPSPSALTEAMVERGAQALATEEGADWNAADFCATPSGCSPEEMREGFRSSARACLASALSPKGGT